MDNPAELYKLIQAGGVVATLLIVGCAFIYAGKKGIWEWGHTAQRERDGKDEIIRIERERADRAEADRDRLHKEMEGQWLPALIKANELAIEYQKIVRRAIEKSVDEA